MMNNLATMGIEVWRPRNGEVSVSTPNELVAYQFMDSAKNPKIYFILSSTGRNLQKENDLAVNIAKVFGLQYEILESIDHLEECEKCIVFQQTISSQILSNQKTVILDFNFEEMLVNPKYKHQLWSALSS